MKRLALWIMDQIWLWKYILAEMLGSLSSRLGLTRLPSTFQAAAATLLPSSLFSTSSFVMADSGGRWWSDRIANKKRKRWCFTKAVVHFQWPNTVAGWDIMTRWSRRGLYLEWGTTLPASRRSIIHYLVRISVVIKSLKRCIIKSLKRFLRSLDKIYVTGRKL